MSTPAPDLRDIETREDCERLVRRFYTHVLDDPIIGFLFTDIARIDLEEHLPKVAAFWETILLGAGTYSGGAFAPHASLHRQVPLRPAHFERWLKLWHEAVDELFAGPRADAAKAHAERVARAFLRRLQGLDQEAPAPIPAALVVTRHRPGEAAA